MCSCSCYCYAAAILTFIAAMIVTIAAVVTSLTIDSPSGCSSGSLSWGETSVVSLMIFYPILTTVLFTVFCTAVSIGRCCACDSYYYDCCKGGQGVRDSGSERCKSVPGHIVRVVILCFRE